MTVCGLVLFGLGFVSLNPGDPSIPRDPRQGWECIIGGLICLTFVAVIFSKEFQRVHPVLFAFGELIVGIVICIVNVRAVHQLSLIGFRSEERRVGKECW